MSGEIWAFNDVKKTFLYYIIGFYNLTTPYTLSANRESLSTLEHTSV